jgi:DnaJ-class molecular chaperone
MSAPQPSAETSPAVRRARYGLSPDATLHEIRRAHRRARQDWHPDKHANAGDLQRKMAVAMYTQVEDDFAILTGIRPDPFQAQSAYTSTTATSNDSQEAPGASSSSSASSVHPFSPSLDVHSPVRVSLADVWRGALVNIEVALQRECASCDGRGCRLCRGGMRMVQGRVRVRLPAGIRPGTVLRAPKMGHDIPLGSRGDGLFTIFWGRRRGWRLKENKDQGLSLEKTLWIPSWAWRSGRSVLVVGPDARIAKIILPAGPSRSMMMTVPSWNRPGIVVRVRLLPVHTWSNPFWPFTQLWCRLGFSVARWRAGLPPTGWIHRPPPDGV